VTYTPIARGTSEWDVPVNDAFTAQDVRITSNETAVANLNGTTSTHTSQIATNTTDIATNTSNITALQTLTNTLDWQAADHSLKAWTQDPATCGSTGTQNTSGTIYLQKIILRQAATISTIHMTVTTAGVTLTAGQNLAALYTSSGTKLVETTDQAAAFVTAGTKAMSLTTPTALAAGIYFVALMTNGTTPPFFMRGGGASGSAININQLPSNGLGRFLDFGTGLTAMPASIAITSAATNGSARWAAIQ
jgi:hypothetical protein